MDWAGRLRATVLALDGVVEARSKFGPAAWAYNVGGREFLHFHAPTLVDVRLTRPLIAALEPDERAHCVLRKAASSDWVEVRIGSDDGWAVAAAAARRAWDAARSPQARQPSTRGTSGGTARGSSRGKTTAKARSPRRRA